MWKVASSSAGELVTALANARSYMSTLSELEPSPERSATRADGSGNASAATAPTKRPAANPFPSLRWLETREHVTVVAIVPGFARKDLEITLKKDLLSIAGHLSGQVPSGFVARQQSRKGSHFRRELKLSSEVTWSDTHAHLERGVLTIQLRKDLPASRPSIPIRLT
jgi:HSP20 family molecular chaperone IbpA